jgi:hypothetical protein
MSLIKLLLKEDVRVFDAKKLLRGDIVEPIKDSDTIRVYHGFNRFNDAYEVCKHGMSGSDRASRLYSYEYVNNPQGLFVTIDFKTAKKFVGAYPPSVIIEFSSKASDLEAPSWKSGGYTVQGGYSQQFENNEDRENEKMRRKSLVLAISKHSYIKDSDDPLMADYLLNSAEYQALFRGDLNPNMIKYVWVTMGDTINRKFERITVKEFLKNFVVYYTKEYSSKENLLLKPKDTFSWELLIKNAMNKNNGLTEEYIRDTFEYMLQSENVRNLLVYMNMRQVEEALGKKYDPFLMEFK